MYILHTKDNFVKLASYVSDADRPFPQGRSAQKTWRFCPEYAIEVFSVEEVFPDLRRATSGEHVLGNVEMTTNAKKVRDKALALPPDERADVAVTLLESLDEVDPCISSLRLCVFASLCRGFGAIRDRINEILYLVDNKDRLGRQLFASGRRAERFDKRYLPG